MTTATATHVTDRAARIAARTAPHAALPRRERRAVSYCDIWDLVAPGEPCPACETSFEERLARAKKTR